MTTSPAPTPSPTPSQKPADIEARLEQNRAELAATIDELTDRLDPRVRATETVTRARQLLQDAGTGPASSPRARDHARKVLGIAALGVAGFVTLVAAVARRR